MLALAAAFGCILVNAFFVAAEFGLAKVRTTALETASRAGDASATRALGLLKQLDAYLAATQLGITLASLALGWLGEPAVAEMLAPLFRALYVSPHTAHEIAIGCGFAVISAAHIILGELVPKSFALARPDEVARRVALPLRIFYVATYPALALLDAASRLVLRAMRLPRVDHDQVRLSLEELQLVIHESQDHDPTRRALLERVLRATDRPIRAIMVPRTEMHVLSLSDDPDAWMEKVRRFGFSRYPVSEDGSIDRVVGYVYVKDLLMASRRRRPRAIAELRREILVVPATSTLSTVLERFEESAVPIALVVDEHGGTAGLLTIEDVVLELVGDLRGELGHAKGGIALDDEGSVVADGRALIEDVGLAAVPIDGEASKGTSVAAWIVTRLGRLAQPGDVVEVGAWEAVVEDVRARRVHRVRFHPKRSEVAPA